MPHRALKTGEIIEWALILLATVSLWPWVFHYRPAWYPVVLAAALIAMLWVFVRRAGRVRRRR